MDANSMKMQTLDAALTNCLNTAQNAVATIDNRSYPILLPSRPCGPDKNSWALQKIMKSVPESGVRR